MILGLYRGILHLYPQEFRERYATEMFDCAKRILDEDGYYFGPVLVLLTDLIGSLFREHFEMNFSRLPQLAMLLVITTFIAGTGYLISQQVLRMSANDPQIQMAEDSAARMTAGGASDTILPSQSVEMSTSLSPFVIVYDSQGKPIASSGRLDGAIPKPPQGVLDFVRDKGEERVTWQPRAGVRIASVVTHFDKGFVLAGRNMREVEEREAVVFKLAALGWLFANLALVGIWLLAGVMRTGSPRLSTTA